MYSNGWTTYICMNWWNFRCQALLIGTGMFHLLFLCRFASLWPFGLDRLLAPGSSCAPMWYTMSGISRKVSCGSSKMWKWFLGLYLRLIFRFRPLQVRLCGETGGNAVPSSAIFGRSHVWMLWLCGSPGEVVHNALLGGQGWLSVGQHGQPG